MSITIGLIGFMVAIFIILWSAYQMLKSMEQGNFKMNKAIGYFKNTWLDIMKTPSDFYEQMPTEGGYIKPVGFAATSFLIAGIGMALTMPDDSLILIISMPILGIINALFGGLFAHIFFKIMGGKGTYESTVRFVSYASAPVALIWLPLVGLFVGVYVKYMEVIAGAKVHRISILSSIVVVFVIPFIILTVTSVMSGRY